MKVICIGRNFAEHAKELNNRVTSEPVFFMKPDSSLLINNFPFYIPDFSNEIHYEVELILKVSRLGKNIDKRFAHRYYDKIGLGVDFTARDVQRVCKEKGLPWEKAKGFDASAVVGKFVPKEKFKSSSISFSLLKNGERVQSGNSSDMIFSFDEIIAYVSKFLTLKIGDLIYTGTPAGVGKVSIGDQLKGYIGDELFFDFLIK